MIKKTQNHLHLMIHLLLAKHLLCCREQLLKNSITGQESQPFVDLKHILKHLSIHNNYTAIRAHLVQSTQGSRILLLLLLFLHVEQPQLLWRLKVMERAGAGNMSNVHQCCRPD